MDELIYDQRSLPRDQYRYGLRASADTGCGWIATHNALRLLGCRTDTQALVRYYEWLLPLIHGNAGTSFWAPAVCFRKWGFRTALTADRRRLDEAARAADVCILFYRWKKGIRTGAHFIALRHTENDFEIYNHREKNTGPEAIGPSLEAFLRENRYFSPILTTISRK